MDAQIKEKVDLWLNSPIDEKDKEALRALAHNDPEGLTDAFYKNLEFGTGGLRGVMGVGTNRMNIYTVGMATQGLSNYLKMTFPNEEIKVAVACDSRNNSPLFAQTCANIFSANGFEVYLFEELRPTPELSFAIRHLGCKSGVVITASHNPKEYNGFKAYWTDGAQLIPPHDKNVIEEVNKIAGIEDVMFEGDESKIHKIGKKVDEAYLEAIESIVVDPEVIKRQHDLKIVFSPIHGTGITMVPQILKKLGFTNVSVVEEQSKADGNFPTVVYPNPEEAEAMTLAMDQAIATNADIVMATDPDSDRVGIGVKNNHGEWQLLNGNQTGALIINYLLKALREKNGIQDNHYIVKTIVTSDLLDKIAEGYGVTCYNTLTGFKYIAELIREKEGVEVFIGGGEESYGYLIGDKVRDKDAIASCAIIAELTASLKDQGKTVFDELIEIYKAYGLYREKLVSITKKGQSGAEEIQAMMSRFREEPPRELAGSPVTSVLDYKSSVATHLADGSTETINLPGANVLQFLTADGSKVSARPSGTEPKIKFYVSVKGDVGDDFDKAWRELDEKADKVLAQLTGEE